MPTTITQLISKFNLPNVGRVKWFEKIQTESEGIYIVSLSDNPNCNSGTLNDLPISKDIIEKWIAKVNGFELDKVKTHDSELIIQRLSKFWLPDENILYIGKAPLRKNGKGLANRINEFYNTEYGNKRPHAGGHWLKSLNVLNDLFIYYLTTTNSDKIEKELLKYFCKNVTERTRKILKDKELPLPFGNLELNKGQIKNHGLGKMKK